MQPRELERSRRNGSTPAITALFVISGACTLIYQIVWVRMLVVVFGASVLAVTTVVAAFMGGLALGGAVFGRVVDRRGHPLLWFALLEAGVGTFALGFPVLLARLDGLYTSIYRSIGGEGPAFALIRVLLGFLVLLVPTTLMGGTLPVLTRFVVPRFERLGGGVGALYAANTLGAAAGCFAAAFVLMERFGIRDTVRLAALANLGVAAAALLLARGRRGASPPPQDAGGERRSSRIPALAVRAAFWGYAASGLTALGYEVVWTRILTIGMGVTTAQSLSTILVAYLLGLAGGGAVGAVLADRWKRPVLTFALLEVLLGLLGLVSLVALGAIPDLVEALGPAYTWAGHVWRLSLVTLAVVLAPTFVMGLLFPVATKVYAGGVRRLGARVGGIYAANTGGAIAGAFLTGFVLIPRLGSQGSIELLGGLNVAVGLGLLACAPSPSRRARAAAAAAAAVTAAVLWLAIPRELLVGLLGRVEGGATLVYHDEGAAGTVTVYDRPDGTRLLKVNGAGEVPTDAASIRTFRLLGSLASLLHPEPEEILVIAFGGGITLSTVELHRPRRIDCVELVPEVVGAAGLFARFNRSIGDRLDDGHLRIIADDGRNHVLRSTERYDAIVSDSTHPGTADSWMLYTEEFYRLCRERLAPDGLMAQWVPLHGLAADDFKMILRTFRTVFPHASLWMTEGYSVLLGSVPPLEIDLARLRGRLGDPAVHAALAEVDLGDPYSFLAAMAMDETAIAAWTGPGPINTDDRPQVSFAGASRSGASGDLAVVLSAGPYYSRSIASRLIGATAEERERLDRRFAAREHALKGAVALRFGRRSDARTAFRRALALDPEEPTARRALATLE